MITIGRVGKEWYLYDSSGGYYVQSSSRKRVIQLYEELVGERA